MCKYLPLILILSIFGCAGEGQESERIELEFSFTVDTVRIDAGEHLFFLGYGLAQPRLSPDEQFLYFYDNLAHALEKVDLTNEQYVATINLDKEGPKGIEWPQDYVPNVNQSIYFVTQRNFVELDENGGLLHFSDKLDNLFEVP